MTTTKPNIKKGQKVKFVVSSADEAVKLLREELGPTAKVLSVRQVDGKGLAKFLTAPKLEIVATLPEDEPAKPVKSERLTDEERELLGAEAPVAVAKNKPAPQPKAAEAKLATVLRSAGFDNAILHRFQLSTDWEKLERIPLKTAMADLARRLRLDYEALIIPPATQTIAFMGQSGVGKTTALCKHLTHEVFFERRAVQVFKLDGETPNSDNALSLYCEVMGVPFVREVSEIDPKAALLVDTSGVNFGDPEEVMNLKKRLEELKVDTRVWVVNAAYENALIDRGLAVAEDLGATHTVYTHLDEVSSTARLWHFVLTGRIPPLFGSVGPAIAHDRTNNIGSVMLEKTFPDFLLK